ncbi:hypothetical protein [Chryseobacterium sp. MEBOG07]|uniref:hypothetical protein n=1 Tax=Chryseobacterium sp. MEBOG07 TaxID=2879939 RepID=UPI001F3C2AE5|nr:hypothetical protein [Chryseobacterium sp. MEBOG07]UKB78320.1 hypothetical protein LF886_17815 [Chryseobacterium sp. MEBOG07]
MKLGLIPNPVTGSFKQILPAMNSFDDLEIKFSFLCPTDYKSFAVNYGEGFVSGCIRVYMPRNIIAMHINWQERINKYYSWRRDVLSQEHAKQSFLIMDTTHGDQVAVFKSKYYFLPHNSDKIIYIGRTFSAAFNWLLANPLNNIKEREFYPEELG